MIKEYLPILNLYKKSFPNLLPIPFVYGLIIYKASIDNDFISSFFFIFLINLHWLSDIYSNKDYKLFISLPINRTSLFKTLCYLSLLIVFIPIVPYVILNLFGLGINHLIIISIIIGNLFNFCLFTFSYSKIAIGSSKIVAFIFLISVFVFFTTTTLINIGVLNITLCTLILIILIPTTYAISLKSFKSRSIL